ncbi:MAG: arylsulfatase, partial [Opitutales bacterium]
MKKSFLLYLAVFASLSLVAKAKRPHVLLMVSDDMSWNDVGYHGSRVKTPNIDQLAKEGVQLDRFYVHPVCSPTRVALMTARSPARFGVTGPMGRDQGVPVEERFLPQAFEAAGYQTFMVGKWHLGHSREGYLPLARGFDPFYGFLGGGVDYYTHMGPRRVDWQRNGKTVDEEGYTTDLFADEAVRLLKNRDKERPVFLYLPFNAPHSPFQAPQALIQKYRGLGVFGRDILRFACIDALDQAIGRVLATLEEEAMAKDTLVIFFCDNGAGAGRRPLRGPARANNGQSLALRGGKGSVLEGGIRVPAVIRWPGVIQAGSTSQQLLSAQDLFPTLATAAGIPHGIKQPLDGEDLWKAIRGNRAMP